jgi:RND family efflux transporter MFP subunit
VTTAPLRQVSLSDDVTAFGEVATGQVVAISFPRAGQVSRLLVVPGQRVRRGTPLVTLIGDPMSALTFTQAQTTVAFAQGELRRIDELFGLQLATQSQVDAARKTLHDAEAALVAQRQLGGAIGAATVTSAFDGVVTAVPVAQGDRVPPGAVLVEVGPTDVYRIQLGVEPEDVRRVRVGSTVVLAAIDDSTKSVATVIAENQGVVDPKTLLINAVAVVPASRATFLVPGMRVRATIKTGERLSWAVPRAALLSDANGAFVYQVAGGRAQRVNVTAGVENQGMVEISGGFDPHLPLVVLGNYELTPGMVVREGSS